MGNYDPRRRGRMEWQGSLGQMLRHGTRVIRICGSGCPFFECVDLDALIAVLGPDGDLMDARPPCPLCEGRNHFMASPGPGTPARPLLSWDRGPDPARPAGGWPPWPPALHTPAMATFTLVITAADGHQHVAPVDFPDAKLAISDAGDLVTAGHTSVAVARGAGDDLEFLGVWDRDGGGGARWTPAEE